MIYWIRHGKHTFYRQRSSAKTDRQPSRNILPGIVYPFTSTVSDDLLHSSRSDILSERRHTLFQWGLHFSDTPCLPSSPRQRKRVSTHVGRRTRVLSGIHRGTHYFRPLNRRVFLRGLEIILVIRQSVPFFGSKRYRYTFFWLYISMYVIQSYRGGRD